MILMPKHRAVFVSTPRCATHTLYSIFEGWHGGQRPGPFHDVAIPERCKDWLTFTCVRNPYERVVSIWRHKRPDMGFAAFLRWLPSQSEPVYLPMHRWHGDLAFDVVLRFETLACDLRALPFWAGPDELPHLNASRGAVGFTDESAALIRALAGDDFERYGYPCG